jgi:integrase/recombinase XerD
MLIETIEAYLATRRAAGFELKGVEFLLRSFARFAVERGDRHVRQQTAIEWAALGPSAQSRDDRLGTVIRFARYVLAPAQSDGDPLT